jgi:hypothetical protein
VDSQPTTATRPPHSTSLTAPAPVDAEDAEGALVENYPHLVRLAYMTLPSALGRHRRVLAAHTLVQQALPRRGHRVVGPGAAQVPGPRGGADTAYALVRQEVLRRALEFCGRPGWRGRVPVVTNTLLPPYVWGLRLHPKAGGTDEPALDRTLAALSPAARAAYALGELEELADRDVRKVLAAAGVTDARAAVNAAAAAEGPSAGPGHRFDPCTVQARPTDLLRRRQHVRVWLAAAAALAVTAGLIATLGGGPTTHAAGGSPGAYPQAFLDPAKLVRARGTAWTDTSRMDFTAWPARGSRTADSELLGRALRAWGRPGGQVRVSATRGTTEGLPAQEPQLLYAADVDSVAVVVFYDGLRIVRYAEPLDGHGQAALDFARVDGADLTTAALVVSRTDGNTRFLTAPWVISAASRDLLAPESADQPLRRSADGVTEPVGMPRADAAAGSCGTTWPVLRFEASSKLGEHRAFLLSDLGDLVPAHLTFSLSTPATPLEATGPQALASWARTACHLGSMRGEGVRSVNNWQYATQQLPEGGGSARWVCTRADTWRGAGRALVLFMPPGAATGADAQGAPVGRSSRDTGACSGFVPHVLAGALWRSAAGHWYMVAAGSPDVARIRATDGVRASAEGNTMAVPAEQGTRAELGAVLQGSGAALTTLR